MGDRIGGGRWPTFWTPAMPLPLCLLKGHDSTKALPMIPCYHPRKLGPVGAKNLNSSLHSQGPIQHSSGPAPPNPSIQP